MQPPINSSVAIARDRKAHKNISTNTVHGNTALDELITVPGPIKRASKKSVVGLGLLISLMLFLVSAVVAANLSTEVNNYLLQTLHIDVRGYFFMLWDWLRRL
ncbi:hypothetical protein KSX_31980 [Ktedonospora formicarum]|uniref:Uncharacterized protein n=2 Tax=Ktedonospora formicarum TaxID=2778364 RepID=A0A8J3MU42_9CHLR|nr:hypothetical protein KSX_31980 [Ktedonospora formicarum]